MTENVNGILGPAIALLIIGLSFGWYAGWKYPNKRNIWIIADVVWLLIGIYTLVGIFSNLSKTDKELQALMARGGVSLQRQYLGESIWKAHDKYCVNSALKGNTAQSLCNWIPKLERVVISPHLYFVSADKFLADMPSSCKTSIPNLELCRDVNEIYGKLSTYNKYYYDNWVSIERSSSYDEFATALPGLLFFIPVWILAFAFRFGRTVSEFFRESSKQVANSF